MRSGVRVLISAASVTAVLFAVAGCGSGGSAKSAASASPSASSAASASTPGAGTLIARMQAAVKSAASVRMSGNVTQNGRAFVLDLRLVRSGDAFGTVSAGAGPVTVLDTGGKAYIKVTAAFLKQGRLPSSACARMCGKWLQLTGSAAKTMTGDYRWPSVFGGLVSQSLPPAASSAATVESASVNGLPAWVISHPDSSAAIYVAAQGPPYLLRLIVGGQQGRVDFTDWNRVTIPPAPPASQVVGLSQLGG